MELDEPTPGITQVTVAEAPVMAEDAPAAEQAWNGALDALASLLEEHRAARS
jgi:hypothetical protein